MDVTVEDAVEEDGHSKSDYVDSIEVNQALEEWGHQSVVSNGAEEPESKGAEEVEAMDAEELAAKGPSVDVLAAILEASPEQTSARRGKQRAADADNDVGSKAERLKATRNEGDKISSSPINIVDSAIFSQLDVIGISLCCDDITINESVVETIEPALSVIDRKIELLEKEEINDIEEEELDKLVLQNICSYVMEEVMDCECDHVVIPSKKKSSDRSKLKGIKVKTSR